MDDFTRRQTAGGSSATGHRHPTAIEITVLTKEGGPLTKRISLGTDGKVASDGSACTMGRGRARRARISSIEDLAPLIESLGTSQALALGALRPDLPEEVGIITKAEADRLGNVENIVARTGSNFIYRAGQPGLVLLDHDTKGMTAEVKRRLADLGGFWLALVSVLAPLGSTGHLIRASTSAGLSRSDTGEALAGSGGLHGYVGIKDGSDAERFLSTLHERCWLAGLGWMIVGTAGQLLERSIVDRMVGGPERLVFEGPPVLEPPLRQDAVGRKPQVTPGEALDTLASCPPLTVIERQTLERLRAMASQRLLPERNRARETFITSQQQRLIERTGMSATAARATIEKQTQGVLLASLTLPFDDADLAGKTVGDVLDDPASFEGETLADPIEGVDYGRCKAKIMRGSGAPFINSFAHGHATYQLRYDAASIRQRLAGATDPVDTFVRMAVAAELDAVENTELVQVVARRSGAGVRDVKARLKAAEKEQKERQATDRRQRELAENTDPRLIREQPSPDGEWLPVMRTLDEVVGAAAVERQAQRDIEGTFTKERRLPIANTHAFTSDTSNEKESS